MAVMEEMLETLQRIEKKLDNLPEAALKGEADLETGKAVYNAEELAEKLGVNRQTIYYQTNQGRIPHIKTGTKLLYPKIAIKNGC